MDKDARNYLSKNALYFTKRETECIHWLSQGKTVPEIGLILEISGRTAEKYIVSIKEKLGCYTLFQLGQKLHNFSLITVEQLRNGFA